MRLRKTLNSIKPYKPGVLKPGAIKLASNENPLGASPYAQEAIKTNAEKAYLYPDAWAGTLKEKIGKKMGVDTEHIVVGNGSDELLVLTCGAYIEEGTNTITSETTFSEYTFATKLFGGEVTYVPMQEGCFDLSGIANKVDENTRIIFLCNPNNPTGTAFSGEDFLSFMKNIPTDVLVVADEAYYEYVTAGDYPDSVSLIPEFPNLLVLRTFSKIYGLAGLRVGYGISTSKVIQDMHKTKTPFNVNSLAQSAAIAALDDEEFLHRSTENNKEGKKYLYSALDELGLYYYKTESNFICLNIECDAQKAFHTLMDMGITIRPLNSFGLNSWIRVTIGTPEQNRFFIRCLEKYLTD